jgi:uncharacterized protein
LGNVKFSRSEKDFLHNNEACRIATSHDAKPQIVPVSYVFEDESFYIATDYQTKKYENIKNNKNVALVVDLYNFIDNKAVSICARDS